MQVITIQGVIENGQIKLTETIEIPEKTVVYVVVPNIEPKRNPRIMSPHLVDKDRMNDFEREIIELTDDEI